MNGELTQAGYRLEVRSGRDTPDQQRDAFMRLVRKGAEVNPATLPDLVENAFVLGTIRHGNELVAVGGLKRPSVEYRTKVFSKAGLSDPGRYAYELGWVYVEVAHRGIGLAGALVRRLVRELEGARAYATTLTTNTSMHRTLASSGFVQAGRDYASSRLGQKLCVFVRAPGNAPA